MTAFGLSSTPPQAGTLIGTAQDVFGAAIPGVRVTLVLAGSREERVSITNARGEYRFEGLLPGRYRTRAHIPGFFEVGLPSVNIEAGRTATWNPVMRVLPIRGIDGLLFSLESWTGPRAADCGRHPVAATADALNRSLACVQEKIASRQPFWALKEQPGIDSHLAHGLLGTPDGRVLVFEWDSAPCGGPGCPPRFTVEACSTPAINADSSRFVCRR